MREIKYIILHHSATDYQANLVSVGICFLGDFENPETSLHWNVAVQGSGEMPIEQFNVGVQLIKMLIEKYNVPLVNVIRHKDVVSDISHAAKSTECPGKNFPYVHILDALRDGKPFSEMNSGQAFDIREDYPYITEVKI